ncbi:MAG: hypothetical protein HQK61_07105 [Desulfamplus sp.]|nr:hypothetical protein [Desulfamplus sp.]
MFLQNCIIGVLGLCGFVRFGNRSWIGMPFNLANDSFSVDDEHNHKQEDELHEIDFDFNDKLRVV